MSRRPSLALAVVLLLPLAGCQTREAVKLPPDQGRAAVTLACPPLPACDIPPGANSTQLTSALWACVLEYRALYSVCFHMAQQ